MKLAILSRSLRAYSTQRLKTAALERGHQVKSWTPCASASTSARTSPI